MIIFSVVHNDPSFVFGGISLEQALHFDMFYLFYFFLSMKR